MDSARRTTLGAGGRDARRAARRRRGCPAPPKSQSPNNLASSPRGVASGTPVADALSSMGAVTRDDTPPSRRTAPPMGGRDGQTQRRRRLPKDHRRRSCRNVGAAFSSGGPPSSKGSRSPSAAATQARCEQVESCRRPGVAQSSTPRAQGVGHERDLQRVSYEIPGHVAETTDAVVVVSPSSRRR